MATRDAWATATAVKLFLGVVGSDQFFRLEPMATGFINRTKTGLWLEIHEAIPSAWPSPGNIGFFPSKGGGTTVNLRRPISIHGTIRVTASKPPVHQVALHAGLDGIL